jgi:DNA adenine methylase
MMKNSKPIIKWIGGKSQILDKLLDNFPNHINNYHEIFLGGGSVLFGVLSTKTITGHVYAYDLNEPLIYMYKNIQDNHEALYDTIQLIIYEYNSCTDAKKGNKKPKDINEAKISKESYYYWIRQTYNNLSEKDKLSIHGSALFIFLNKTCFRGMFRVGPNGFNVPYGNYVKPEIINKEHLNNIHHLIRNVIFECCSFETSLTRIQKDDFVYLDPPYVEENKNSFVSYTINGFGLENHTMLFKMCKELNINFMMSNSDVPLVREHFSNYNIESILCKRSINSKNPESKAKEVIITNY